MGEEVAVGGEKNASRGIKRGGTQAWGIFRLKAKTSFVCFLTLSIFANMTHMVGESPLSLKALEVNVLNRF